MTEVNKAIKLNIPALKVPSAKYLLSQSKTESTFDGELHKTTPLPGGRTFVTMVCQDETDSATDLIDLDAIKAYTTTNHWFVSGPMEYMKQEIVDWLSDRGEELGHDMGFLHYSMPLPEIEKAAEKLELDWKDAFACVQPLYIFDHSGQSVSTTSFSCGWDSGQIGYVVISHEDKAKEWPGYKDYGTSCWTEFLERKCLPLDTSREKATEILGTVEMREYRPSLEMIIDGYVETWDDILQGNVYGFIQGVLPVGMQSSEWSDHTDFDLVGDSCWGFIGEQENCLKESDHDAGYQQAYDRVLIQMQESLGAALHRVGMHHRDSGWEIDLTALGGGYFQTEVSDPLTAVEVLSSALPEGAEVKECKMLLDTGNYELKVKLGEAAPKIEVQEKNDE